QLNLDPLWNISIAGGVDQLTPPPRNTAPSLVRGVDQFVPPPKSTALSMAYPSFTHRSGIEIGQSSNPANQTVTPPSTGLSAREFESSTFDLSQVDNNNLKTNVKPYIDHSLSQNDQHDQ
ncbi:hypothetical protein Dimus_030306, partial [Dionaea muscipula]